MREGELQILPARDVASWERMHRIRQQSWPVAYGGWMGPDGLADAGYHRWQLRLFRLLDDGERQAELLWFEGAPVGYLVCGQGRDPALPDWAELVYLDLLPAYVRRGWGGMMLQRALRQLKRSGYPGIFAWPFAQNTGAQSFFAHWGFYSQNEQREVMLGQESICCTRYLRSL